MAVVYHLKVQNFRGIRSLDWHTCGRIICIVGPGDSAKTTVLNAIELALLPRWNTPFTDSDFYQSDTNEELVIETTVGNLPDVLVKQEKYGFHLRGYSIQAPPPQPELLLSGVGVLSGAIRTSKTSLFALDLR